MSVCRHPDCDCPAPCGADTWFLTIRCTEDAGGQCYVVRADRETLPKVVVVSGPHGDLVAAEGIAKQMRETGTA